MTKAYINYPEPHINCYLNPNSAQIRKHNKVGQRYIKVDLMTISTELSRFANRHYKFASKAGINDMWLELDLGDQKFESEVLQYIHLQIGKYCKPLAPSEIQITLANN